VRFPGHGYLDETEHARLIARYFGTEHVELEANDSTIELLPVLARQFDEPIVDSSMIPTYLVSRMVRQHCKVALGGDGGDELFGGYGHYNRLLWTQHNLHWIPISLRTTISKMAEALLPVGFRGRNWLQSLKTDWERSVPLIATYFDPYMRRCLLSRQKWEFVAEDIRRGRVPKASDLLQRTTRMDFDNYMAEDILVKVDRASMLNSLEVRAPFLDCRLIEFSFGKVPSYLKATANNRKVLLKQLAARLLPSEFDQHRKQGFGIPLASWLQSGPWREYFYEVLLSGDPFFNKKFVHSLLSWQDKGMANSERLFALVIFELWRQEYRVSL
jgi:asparagine synthase (glutamine-hydrolysing)